MIAINFSRVRFFCDLSLMEKSRQKKIKAMIAIKFGRVRFFYDLPLMGKRGQKKIKVMIAIKFCRVSDFFLGLDGAWIGSEKNCRLPGKT